MHILNNLPREKIVHQFDTDFTSFFTIDPIARIDKVFEYYERRMEHHLHEVLIPP